jgi:hypothetical protein
MYGHCVRENCPNRADANPTDEETVEAGANEPAG